jgi:opacity protein-like surface antigen
MFFTVKLGGMRVQGRGLTYLTGGNYLKRLGWGLGLRIGLGVRVWAGWCLYAWIGLGVGVF